MGATISLFLDTRIKKEDDVYPIKIRATLNRQRLYLGIEKDRVNKLLEGSRLEKFRYDGPGNYSIDKTTYEKALKPKVTGVLKDLQIVYKGIEMDAQRVAENLKPFTLDAFKTKYSNRKSKENKVYVQFDEYIKELKASDRVGTAKSYTDAENSLKRFTKEKDVSFEYFTKSKLDQYRGWMKNEENHCSDTTIGFYLRALRTIFNFARRKGITTHYPFIKGSEGVMVPKGKGRKIALNKTELQKIFDYNLSEKHPYSFYLDMWKLMYLLGGLNPTDLCLLRESNIKNGFIYFYREKTKRTSNEQKEIKVPYSDQVQQIIEKWKVPSKKNPYLIPVVDDKMDALKRKVTIGQFVKMINTAMNAIAKDEKLKIDKRITTYVARHSIATQLLQSGASVKFIGDQLGHHDTKITEGYLGSFEEEQIKEAFNLATKF